MTVIELLSKEREDYLSILMDSLFEHRRQFSPAVAELLIEINTTTIAVPYRYIRPDVTCGGKENPKLIEVNKDKYYSFDPIDLTVADTIPGRLFPFYWNGMEFRLFGKIEEWGNLEKWIYRWMDIADEHYIEGKDLSNVVHNVTTPKQVDDYFEFSVDMGSVEVEAFFELLAIFPGMGVTRFDIGSFSMIDELEHFT